MNGWEWFWTWQIDGWALLGLLLSCCLVYLLWKPLPKHLYPSLGFSRLVQESSLRRRFVFLPFWLKSLALFMWAVAWLDPHQMLPREPFSEKAPPASQSGMALYLLVDQSGSMGGPFAQSSLTKWEAVQHALVPFIQKHPQDLIGLISFARTPHLLSPLTLDHPFLLQRLQQLSPVENPEENGTAIGYALYKAVHLIKTMQQALKNSPSPAYHLTEEPRILLITDGFQDPNYLDYGNALRTLELEEIQPLLIQENTHLDILLLYTPSKEFALQKKYLEEMSKKTGGQFSVMKSVHELESFLQRWQGLSQEFSSPLSPPPKRYSLFPIFLLIGLFFYIFAICLETLYLRKVP